MTTSRKPAAVWSSLVDWAWSPRDARGLALFRVFFGAMVCIGALRFLHYGWVDRFFVQPTAFLSYWGLSWIQPASPTVMQGLFWLLAVLGAAVALGIGYRVAVVALFAAFTYVELIDVANYLNHYYFVSLIALIMAFLPANATWSLDAMLRRTKERRTVPAWTYGWLRFQVAVVWLGASLAKVSSDWLVHAQPLNIWLSARVDVPVIGRFLDIWEVALLASWAGFLYDASVPFLLLWRRTRPFAFVAVLAFHSMTHVFFTIGMFPLIMIVSATIFFEADWPTRLLARLRGARTTPTPRTPSPAVASRLRAPIVAALVVWALVQVGMPLRSQLYDGNVLWHEQGMRWSWKVMCREKDGAVTFRVRDGEGREQLVQPRGWLTDHQEREMSSQPDLILREAHRVARQFEVRGWRDVQVYADAVASLNGRRPARLVDPHVDLATISDGVSPATWILPAPTEPPPRLGRRLFVAPHAVASK